jgi:hypothetical protein
MPGRPIAEKENVANWDNVGANDKPYSNDITGVIQTTLPNGNSFPEGAALKAWLGNVGALNANQEIVVPVQTARDNALIGAGNIGTAWVQTDPSITPPSTPYLCCRGRTSGRTSSRRCPIRRRPLGRVRRAGTGATTRPARSRSRTSCSRASDPR